jgi:hypothetical protein
MVQGLKSGLCLLGRQAGRHSIAEAMPQTLKRLLKYRHCLGIQRPIQNIYYIYTYIYILCMKTP